MLEASRAPTLPCRLPDGPRRHAALQVQARLNPDDPPPFTLIKPSEDSVWGQGFAELPCPDTATCSSTSRATPFWRADAGLFFLLGLLERDSDGQWRYQEWWAHDRAEEGAAVADLIDYLDARRKQFPNMHVYHYNHTERSSLVTLTTTHGVAEQRLVNLFETGLFVDLFLVARHAIQVGTESYGLKHLEQPTGFERAHEIDKGAGAVLECEAYMTSQDPASLQRIAA